MSAKLLKAVFVILLLVTIAEAGYYFYVIRSKNFTTRVGNFIATESAITYPTLHPTLHRAAEEKDTLKEVDERRKMVQHNVLTSTVLVDKFESILASIDTKGGILDDFSYRVKISIKVGESDVADFLLNDYGYDRLKVFRLIDGQEQATSLDELTAGDNILIDRKIDVNKDKGNNIIEFKITKI